MVSPIIITSKIFIQELWTLKLDWDDSLPDQLADKWSKFIQQLEYLNNLSFSRWIGRTFTCSYDIHGFCDASQQALAGVVYFRCVNSAGNIHTALICSKTKVDPLKRLTIPRLELSSAVIVTKLVKHISSIFSIDKVPIHLWTDSSVSFTWINSHPSKWKEFVQNRVLYIQETLPAAKWHFVPGKQNPADYATRGG